MVWGGKKQCLAKVRRGSVVQLTLHADEARTLQQLTPVPGLDLLGVVGIYYLWDAMKSLSPQGLSCSRDTQQPGAVTH